jgi:2-amino-4-hydroxy-6-hydroxymethyldihydropteridine diphosphokinase
MPRYVLLLGSNHEAPARLEQARQLINQRFGILHAAEALLTPDRDVAEDRAPYLNQALETASHFEPGALKDVLRDLEAQCGRSRPPKVAGQCEMDIDIALVHSDGGWRALDAKTVAPSYAKQALLSWQFLLEDAPFLERHREAKVS